MRTSVLALLILGLAGCATQRDQLVRSQVAFEQDDYDRALALLRDLERDRSSLGLQEKAQYAYLRGMTDYRLGHVKDARHWLAIAMAYDDGSAGLLPADWRKRAAKALEEMNVVVYDEGLEALVASPR